MAWVSARPNDRWRGNYRDANGKVRIAKGPAGQSSSKSKREALGWANDMESLVRRGGWRDPDVGRMKFSAYFEQHWLPNRMVELNTLKTYESHYKTTLRDEFGEVELRRITSGMIQRWVTSMIREGGHPKTIKAKFLTLQTILAGKKGVSAVRDGLIEDNPCLGVTLPRLEKREASSYSVPEVDLLMKAIGSWWQPLLLLAAESGMRWGELMGLRVSSFSDDFHRVTIRNVILEVTKADTGNGTPFMWKPRPKGGQQRIAGLRSEVAAVLRQRVIDLDLDTEDRMFSMPAKDGRVLRTPEWPDGRPVSRTTFRDFWERAHLEAGLPQEGRRFHDIRGSHISWLLEGGADLPSVMRRVGHKQISTTQGYIDPGRHADDRALAALRALRGKYEASDDVDGSGSLHELPEDS
jgi:integrase